MTPDDLAGLIASGAVQPPPNIEANYAASMIEWARQTYDGRMDFAAVTTTTVEDMLGRKPLTLRTWVARNREAVLEAGGGRQVEPAPPRLIDPARRTGCCTSACPPTPLRVSASQRTVAGNC